MIGGIDFQGLACDIDGYPDHGSIMGNEASMCCLRVLGRAKTGGKGSTPDCQVKEYGISGYGWQGDTGAWEL